MTTQHQDLIALYEAATRQMRRVLAGVKPAQLSQSTPCSEWDVKALTDHIVGGPARWAGMIAGDQPATPGALMSAAPGASHPDLPAAYEASAAKFLAEVRKPGALQKTINMRGREMKVGDFVGIPALSDTVIHTWDLAKATGQESKLDATLVQATWELMAPRMATAQPSPAFKAAVPVSSTADTQAKLLGISGRDPAWKPN